MKAVKIILAIVVVAIIGFFVTKWSKKNDPPKDINLPKNQYTERDSIMIDSLKRIPVDKFCKVYYLKVQATIDEDFRNGSLGLTSYKEGNIWKEKKDDNLNNQWNEILSKNLYSAYAPKFVEQAMYVFSRSEWKDADLTFIRSEVKSLQSSAYLGSTGLVTSFDEINTILAKYDEINNFINSCNNFAYYNYDLEKTYPDVNDKIQKSKEYIFNHLDNSYVNNCTRLNEGLHTIPKILFDKHILYLTNIINHNKDRYSEFDFQRDYSNTIYIPLRNQVDALNNDIYNLQYYIFDNGYKSVYNLLSEKNREATDYFIKILEKYEEINSFISSCNAISYHDYDLISKFPDVNEKIRKSQAYLSDNLNNHYLENNSQVKDGLQNVPKILFDKQINYLRTKIENNGSKYSDYLNHSEYINAIYNPLKKQVDAININIYGISNSDFDSEFKSLVDLITRINNDAKNYYNSKK